MPILILQSNAAITVLPGTDLQVVIINLLQAIHDQLAALAAGPSVSAEQGQALLTKLQDLKGHLDKVGPSGSQP